MKIADTISVNPSKTTLGHVDASSSTIFRSPVIGMENTTRQLDVMSLVFPAPAEGVSDFKKYSVPLRTIMATILIVSGISSFTLPALAFLGTSTAICSICFGAFLALGFLTRPVMIGGSVFYCIMGALSLRAGAADLTVFSLMFGCLVFAVTGSGKYSCDTLLRAAIRRHKVSKKDNYLGYKAFHNVKY